MRALGLVLMMAVAQAEDRSPRWLLTKVHADWCVGCKALGPTGPMVPDGARACGLRATMWDVTGTEQTRRSRARAEALGLGEVFAREHLRTGVVLLVDLQEDEVAARWTVKDGVEGVREGVARHLAGCMEAPTGAERTAPPGPGVGTDGAG